jgi:acyl carrier protein
VVGWAQPPEERTLSDEIASTIRRLVAQYCALSMEKIQDQGMLVGYGMDSVRTLDLLMALEDEYGIQIDEQDPELGQIKTIADLAALVERRR